ncbi:MAG: ester cyclase [Bryobacteraceae bacterium]|nr:ester cyclase [Bryobacteraceae bacterium]
MPIEIQGMAPLLQVFDMSASLRFYRDILGFELAGSSAASEPFDWVMLRRDGVTIMLNTAYETDSRPPAPDPARMAGHQDTALYFGCEDLDGAFAQLRACGVEAEPPVVQAYGMKQVYLKDPDGYVICFQWPAMDAKLQQFAERYTAAWCAHDPAGVAAHFASDGWLRVNGGDRAVGRLAIAEVARGFMTEFPDLRVLFDGLATRGDRTEYRWTLTGTHSGSRNRVRISGRELWKLDAGGLIEESEGSFDAADYQRQIGM